MAAARVEVGRSSSSPAEVLSRAAAAHVPPAWASPQGQTTPQRDVRVVAVRAPARATEMHGSGAAATSQVSLGSCRLLILWPVPLTALRLCHGWERTAQRWREALEHRHQLEGCHRKTGNEGPQPREGLQRLVPLISLLAPMALLAPMSSQSEPAQHWADESVGA